MFVSSSRLWTSIISAPRSRALPMTANFNASLRNSQRSSVSSMTTQFTHSCEIDAEPLHLYRPGGYHPILLSDTFKNGRYKLLHKAGWGGYATTWVARDREQYRYVALKFSVAEKNNSGEIQVLQAVSALPQEHPGRANCVQMLDSFTVNGPNGTHDCLVFELLGPSVVDVMGSYTDNRLPAALAKSTAYKALLGLDYLHRYKIGHADLHSKNLTFTLPNFDCLDKPQFYDQLGEPETASIHRTDGMVLTSHVPSYIVRPSSFASREILQHLRSSPGVKIIDFGESFIEGQSPVTVHTPLALRAPEAIFGDLLDHRVDLWSMGCLLFELVTGQPPFDTIMSNTSILVSQMMEFSTDKLPQRWQEKWHAMSKTACSDDTPYTLHGWLEEVYMHDNRRTEFTNQDITKISELVGRMLTFEPSSRALAGDILDDPWFKSFSSQ